MNDVDSDPDRGQGVTPDELILDTAQPREDIPTSRPYTVYLAQSV